MPDLTIPLDKLAFIVIKAHEASAEVDPVDPEDASNQSDDAERQVLEDRDENGSYQELYDALLALNADELDEVAALRAIGRGDFEPAEWTNALAAVRDATDARVPQRLAADPLLGTHLEDALDGLGYSLEDLESDRL